MARSISKGIFALLLAMLVAGTVWASGQREPSDQGEGPVNLRFWALMSGSDGEVIKAMVDAFNAEQDDISVTFDVTVWDAYYQQLTAAIAGGDAPDIAIAHTANLPAFASDRLLNNYDSAVDSELLDPDNFVPVAWNGGFQNGHQYGVPLDTIAAMVLFYNTKYFEQAGLSAPPQTYEELLDYAHQLQDNSDALYGYDMPLHNGMRLYRHWYSALYQNGGSLLNENATEAAFNTPAGVEALQCWVDMVHTEQVSPADSVNDAFQLGEVAMSLDGVWRVNAYRQQENLEWSLFAMPALFGGDRRNFFSNSHNFILPKYPGQTEAQVEAARRFVAWMSDNSIIWSERAGMITARRDIIQQPGFYDIPYMSEIAKQVEYATYPPLITQTGEIQSAIIQELELAFGGTKPAGQALADAETRVNEILSR